MTISEAFIQLKAFARIDGLLMALLWAGSFLMVCQDPQSVFGSLLILATPFVAAQRLKTFRDHVLDGLISLRRGYAYLWFVFFYAALLFAAFQFVYFRFFDHGTFMAMIISTCQTIEQIYKSQHLPVAELHQTINQLRSIGDVDLVLAFYSQNLFLCTLLSLPVAAIMRRTVAKPK